MLAVDALPLCCTSTLSPSCCGQLHKLTLQLQCPSSSPISTPPSAHSSSASKRGSQETPWPPLLQWPILCVWVERGGLLVSRLVPVTIPATSPDCLCPPTLPASHSCFQKSSPDSPISGCTSEGIQGRRTQRRHHRKARYKCPYFRGVQGTEVSQTQAIRVLEQMAWSFVEPFEKHSVAQASERLPKGKGMRVDLFHQSPGSPVHSPREGNVDMQMELPHLICKTF